MSFGPAATVSALGLLGSLLVGCGGSDLMLPNDGGGSGAPTAIRVLTGDGQSGEVGQLLAPVVVEVTDGAGSPVSGATVAFVLISAGDGAQVLPSIDTTDASGHAEARVRLGDQLGLQTAEAQVMVDGALVRRAAFSAMATGNSPDNGPNEAPHADFEVHCSDLTCVFVDKSEDKDGQIVSWQWTFGDGAGSGERNPVHTYSAKGKYDVLLVVTDNGGASDAKDHDADAKD